MKELLTSQQIIDSYTRQFMDAGHGPRMAKRNAMLMVMIKHNWKKKIRTKKKICK